MISGELLFCGGSNWDLTGRKTVPKAGETLETFLPVFVTRRYSACILNFTHETTKSTTHIQFPYEVFIPVPFSSFAVC